MTNEPIGIQEAALLYQQGELTDEQICQFSELPIDEKLHMRVFNGKYNIEMHIMNNRQNYMEENMITSFTEVGETLKDFGEDIQAMRDLVEKGAEDTEEVETGQTQYDEHLDREEEKVHLDLGTEEEYIPLHPDTVEPMETYGPEYSPEQVLSFSDMFEESETQTDDQQA